MSRILDKTAILNRIKDHYGLKTNAEYAAFLGVAPTTLSSWYARKTFDLDIIYSKCEDLDIEWIFTGRTENKPKCTCTQNALSKEQSKETSTDQHLLDRIIEQAEVIGSLKERIKQLEREKDMSALDAQDSIRANAG